MIKSRNEESEDHSSFDKPKHRNKELKNINEEETMKRHGKGRVEEDEVFENGCKK